MTELKSFLVALCDALSEAETEALVHGRNRFLELVENEQVPREISVPVYHATNMNVSLDAGLAVERTETETEIHLTEPSEDDSTLSFEAEVFDLIGVEDIETIDYEDVVSEYPGELPAAPDVDRPSEGEPEEVGESDEGEREELANEGREQEKQGESRRVDAVEGIAQPTADVLKRSGIETVADLLGRTPEELRGIGREEEAVSPEQVDSWLRAARSTAGAAGDSGLERPVGSVDGIGPAYGERLRNAGIETLASLVRRQPEEIADVVSTDSHIVTPERTAQWIDRAEERLRTLNGRAEESEDV